MLSLHQLRWSFVFSFIILIWYVTLIVFHMLNNVCYPGINPTWSWWRNHLTCCRIQFAGIVEDFCISIYKEYWSVVYPCSVFVWLWYQGNVDLIEWVKKCSLLFSFCKNLTRIGVNASLFCRIHQWTRLVLGFSLLGYFLLLIQPSLVIIGLFRFYGFFMIQSW